MTAERNFDPPMAFHPFSRMCFSPIEMYVDSILASGSKASPKTIVKRAAAIAQAVRDHHKAEREEYEALKKEKDDNIRKINEKIRTNPRLLKFKKQIDDVRVESQPLLNPLLLKLTPQEKIAWDFCPILLSSFHHRYAPSPAIHPRNNAQEIYGF